MCAANCCSNSAWSRCTSQSTSNPLVLENVGGSTTAKSHFSFGRRLSRNDLVSLRTTLCTGPVNPLRSKFSRAQSVYVDDLSTVVVLTAPPAAAYTVNEPV